MDIATIIGFVVGLATVFVVLIMDGGSPAELFAHPSAIILIIGGSLSANTRASGMPANARFIRRSTPET